MYCRHCKTAIPEGAAFCIECGEPVDEEEQAGKEALQQPTEERPDQTIEKDIPQQVDSDEELPSIQPTKSFDPLEEETKEEGAAEEEKTPEELALDHLFTDDEDVEKDADRADITRQIAPVETQADMSKEKNTEQLLISADRKKQKSGKKASDKQKNSSDPTQQMDLAEVEQHAQLDDKNTQDAKTSIGTDGNSQQTQQQVADASQKAASIRASDRHVITVIVIVIIAIFATIALTCALVYFDPFDLGNTQESTDSQAEDTSETEGEDSETADTSDAHFENDADEDIYVVDSDLISVLGAASNRQCAYILR